MNKPRQTTLFQSWSASHKPPSSANSKKGGHAGSSEVIDLCDDDDDEELLRAMELSVQEYEMSSANHNPTKEAPGKKEMANRASTAGGSSSSGLFSTVSRSSSDPKPSTSGFKSNSGATSKPSSKQGTLLKYQTHKPYNNIGKLAEGSEVQNEEEEEPVELTDEELAALENLPGFDKVAGQRWIYPTNYPVREYQFNIVRAALFINTLVVLPTGLGKTFVAAVIMYNFYRWYPQGKVVFMAPTKPLVAQQIEACYSIMGIPQDDTAEMTGAMQPAERKRSWQQRRVFFLTPQVLVNDLSRGACPALLIKCLVVDEAHKALGNHAYCQVVRELAKYEGDFRVLALSATPGSDMKAVQQVITNLLIAHVELRGEDCPDIKPYTHERRVEKVVVPLGEELTAARDMYLKVMNVVVSRLKRQGVLYNREVTSLSKFLILKARDAFRQNPPHSLQQHQFGVVEGDFAMAMSLYHGYDLLLLHGLRSLFSFLLGIVNGEKGYGRTRAELLRNADFNQLVELLKEKFAPIKNAIPQTQLTQKSSQSSTDFAVGHPKMAKLQDIVLEHFKRFQDGSRDASPADSMSVATRIMIFSQFRDSVNEITEMLNRHRPLVKCMSFIGQSSVGKSAKGFTQKEQLKVMRMFREGGYNTLVSTCVGEEGLDIGDVDLIVCFDAHKSPIRLVQRMGRTGRKREGSIIMLVTAGKEEQIYNQSQYSKRSIHKAIENGARSLVFYPGSSRMVPNGLDPYCHRMHITVSEQYKGKAKGKASDKVMSKFETKVKPRPTATRKKQKEDGYLTAEELTYWSENYKVPDNEVPKLPLSTAFVSLKPAEDPSSTETGGPLLSLSEWMPWQNCLHDVIKVSHSTRTRNFVELVEMMEVQSAVGGEEDTYGQEMSLFLNKEDVFVKQAKKPGLLRYCTPTPSTSGANIREDSSSKAKVIAKRSTECGTVRKKTDPPRRSEQLPTFSSSEDEQLNQGNDSCSEEDIIAVDGLFIRGEIMEVDEVIGTKGKTLRKGNTKKSVKAGPQPLIDIGKPEKLKQSVKKKKTTKKRSAESVNQSAIELIDEPADEDFEGMEMSAVMPIDVPSASESQTAALSKGSHTIRGLDKAFVGQCINGNVLLESDKAALFEHERDTPQVASLSEILPIFSQQRDFHSTGQVRSSSQCEIDPNYQVVTPPPVEELEKALADLDTKGRVSPVEDILTLIDNWEKEKTGLIGKPVEAEKVEDMDTVSFPMSAKSAGRDTQQPPKMSTALTPIRIRVSAAVTDESVVEKTAQLCHDAVEEEQYDDVFFDSSMMPFNDYNNVNDVKPKSSVNQQADVANDENLSKFNSKDEKKLPPTDSGQMTDSHSLRPVSPVTPLFSKMPRHVGFALDTSTPIMSTGGSLRKKPLLKKTPFTVESAPQYNATDVSNIIGGDKQGTKTLPHTDGVEQYRNSDAMMDSFLSGVHDNSLLMGIATPATSANKPTRLSGPRVAETSQLTFTQALACCNESPSPHTSHSTSSKGSEGWLPLEDVITPKKDPVVTEGKDQKAMTRKRGQAAEQTAQSGQQTKTAILAARKGVLPGGLLSNGSRCPPETAARGTGQTLPTSKGQAGRVTDELLESNGAHFDLGIDLDDFDEEMVIPPSPEATVSQQSFSQRSRGFGTRLCFDNVASANHSDLRGKVGTGRADKQVLPKETQTSVTEGNRNAYQANIENKVRSTESTCVVDETEGVWPMLDEMHESDFEEDMAIDDQPMIEATSHHTMEDHSNLDRSESPSLLHSVSQSDRKPLQHGNDKRNQYKRMAHSHSKLGTVQNTPMAMVSPLVQPSQKLPRVATRTVAGEDRSAVTDHDVGAELTDSLAAAFANSDSDELFFDDDQSYLAEATEMAGAGPSEQNDIYTGAASICPSNVSRTSHSEEQFKTPIKPAPKASKSRVSKQFADTLSEDDSPVVVNHKRKRVIVTSDEDSPVIVRKRVMTTTTTTTVKRTTERVFDPIAVSDDEDDEDFIETWPLRKVTHQKESQNTRTKSRKKLRSTGDAAAFVEIEAERSEDDCSEDDSEGSDLDQYEGSFINDYSQMSQPCQGDMRAIYLKSVRSPNKPDSRFRFSRGVDVDVFSQVPVQDADYMEDSFVVHGDDIEIPEDEAGFSDPDAEVTLMGVGADVTMSRQTRRQARQAALRRARGSGPKRQGAARRRVVQRADSSSEEEPVEMVGGERLQPEPGVGNNRVSKARAILSSSTSDSSRASSRQSTTSDEEAVLSGRAQPLSRAAAWTKSNDHTTPTLATQGVAVTQLPPLEERCRQRLHAVQGDRPEAVISERTKNPAATAAVRMAAGTRMTATAERNASKSLEVGATFSLGDLLGDDEDWEDDVEEEEQKKKKKTATNPASPEIKRAPRRSPDHSQSVLEPGETEAGQSVGWAAVGDVSSVASRTAATTTAHPDQLSARERRLRLSRQKQEEFRRKFGAASTKSALSTPLPSSSAGTNGDGRGQGGGFHGSQIVPPPESPLVRDEPKTPVPTPPPPDAYGSTLVTPLEKGPQRRLVILVDSREINGAQDLMSTLRFRHNIQTAVRQLASCDYVLSNRMAVHRKLLSAFTNGAQRVKLVERVRELCDHYDRPCLIIERDRVKPGEERSSRHVPQTKYVSMVMAALAQTHIKLIFTETQEQTAELLANLATQEEKKGQAIAVPVELSTPQEQVLRFYLTLPRIGYMAALNLVHAYPAPADVARCSLALLQRRGHLSAGRAAELSAFLRREFDPQMLPAGR